MTTALEDTLNDSLNEDLLSESIIVSFKISGTYARSESGFVDVVWAEQIWI